MVMCSVSERTVFPTGVVVEIVGVLDFPPKRDTQTFVVILNILIIEVCTAITISLSSPSVRDKRKAVIQRATKDRRNARASAIAITVIIIILI